MVVLSSLAEPDLAAALTQAGLPPAAVARVLEARPYADDDALLASVESAIVHLDDADLIAALDSVGEPVVQQGDADTIDAATLALRLYRERFGYPFVSAIATPTADDLLMRVRIRLGNEAGPEGRAARDHLRRIVRARLQA